MFIVPQQQYDELNEERDPLIDLRRAQGGFQSTDTPSTGANPSILCERQASHTYEFNRPRPGVYYPIPVSLLQPEFGHFRRDVRTIAPDPRLSPLVRQLARELSSLSIDRELRKLRLQYFLTKLFGGVTFEKRSIGSYGTGGGFGHIPLSDLPIDPILIEVGDETTCGSSDAVSKLLLSYKERVGHALHRDFLHKGDWLKTRLPSILLLHDGRPLADITKQEPYSRLTINQGPIFKSTEAYGCRRDT